MISCTSYGINGLEPIIPEKVINRFCFLAVCMRPKLLVVFCGDGMFEIESDQIQVCVCFTLLQYTHWICCFGMHFCHRITCLSLSRGITMYSIRNLVKMVFLK
jgi:hypothetical protein